MKTMKKITAMLLAVIMITLSVPLVFAEADGLSAENIVEWPTLEGEIFYGQTIEESTLTLVDGKVAVDGENIDGHFEFVDTEIRPEPEEIAQLKFIPDDTENYEGFDMLDTGIAIPVSKTTPIYTSLPVAANKLSAVGNRLSTVKLSSNPLINPYTGEEIPKSSWGWTSRNSSISAPGLYEVRSAIGGGALKYNPIYAKVWVSIEGVDDSLCPTIIENPTFTETVRLNPEKTWGDYTLTGGKATVKDANGNDIEAKGTFVVADAYKTAPINNAGSNSIVVQFISDDTSVASSLPFTMIVDVERPLVAWKDGEAPVVTLPYGTEIRYGQLEIDNKLLNAYDTTYWDGWKFAIYDLDKNRLDGDYKLDCGTYNYLVHPTTAFIPLRNNWDNTDVYLPVTVVVEPGKGNFKNVRYNNKTGEISGNVGNSYLYGSVDVIVNGELYKNVPVNNSGFRTEWAPADKATNAVYDLKLVYKPAENDNGVLTEAYEGKMEYKAVRAITVDGNWKLSIDVTNDYNTTSMYNPDPENNVWGTHDVRAGYTVKINSEFSDLINWIITDEKGNEIEVEIVKGDMNSRDMTFIMPDGVINITYIRQYDLDNQAKIDECECLCHSDNQFVQFFWKIFYKIIEILNKLGADIKCRCGFPHGTNSAY